MRFYLIPIVLTVGFLVSVASKAEEHAACLTHRELTSENGQTFYTVTERARSLYMISRDLYGHEKNWRHIARWNHITAPYHIDRGQKLLIKVPARLNEEEANRVLIAAWTKLKDTETVSLFTCEKRQTASEAASDSSAAAAPEPVEEIREALEPEVKEITRVHWRGTVGAESSVFQLKSVDATDGVTNKLNSKLNYGFDAGLNYQAFENFGFWLRGGVEHIQITPAQGGTVGDGQKDLANVSLGGEYQIVNPLAVYLNGRYVQRPFSQPTLQGTDIDGVSIPELLVGDRLTLMAWSRLDLLLVTEASYSFSVRDSGYDVKTGYGYTAGLRFDYKVRGEILTLSPTYHYLSENTSVAKNTQQAAVVDLGVIW